MINPVNVADGSPFGGPRSPTDVRRAGASITACVSMSKSPAGAPKNTRPGPVITAKSTEMRAVAGASLVQTRIGRLEVSGCAVDPGWIDDPFGTDADVALAGVGSRHESRRWPCRGTSRSGAPRRR